MAEYFTNTNGREYNLVGSTTHKLVWLQFQQLDVVHTFDDNNNSCLLLLTGYEKL